MTFRTLSWKTVLGIDSRNSLVVELFWPHVAVICAIAFGFGIFAFITNAIYRCCSCRKKRKWTWIGLTGLCSSRIPVYLRAFLWYAIVFGALPALLFTTHEYSAIWGYFSLRMDKMTFFMFLYYLYRVVAYTFANYPYNRPAKKHRKSVMDQIGVLIPCHKSADEIADTLKSILKNHIPPANIVVADNANASEPPDDTRSKVKAVDSRIKYIFVQQGLKTRAFWEAIQFLPPRVKYIIHIDDDTIFMEGFHFDLRPFEEDPDLSGVSWGIAMFPRSTVERLVDFEFKQFSQWRYWRGVSSTTWFCHGIIGIWRRDRFELMLEQHPFLPFGEDNWIGSMNMMAGYHLSCDLRNIVYTFAPPNLTGWFQCCGGAFQREQGYGAANVWKQRAKRWFVNAPRRIIWRLYFFFFYSTGSLIGDIIYRFELAIHLLGIFVTLAAPFIFVKACMDNQIIPMLYFKAYYCLINLLLSCYLNYWLWGHRKDLQVSFTTILLFPFYKIFLHLCAVFGHWRCLFYYIPWFPFRTGLFTIDRETGAEFGVLKGEVLVEDTQEVEEVINQRLRDSSLLKHSRSRSGTSSDKRGSYLKIPINAQNYRMLSGGSGRRVTPVKGRKC